MNLIYLLTMIGFFFCWVSKCVCVCMCVRIDVKMRETANVAKGSARTWTQWRRWTTTYLVRIMKEKERERVQKKAQTEETRIFALASIPMPAIHTRTNHPVRCWQFQKNLIPPPSLKWVYLWEFPIFLLRAHSPLHSFVTRHSDGVPCSIHSHTHTPTALSIQ